MFMTLVILLTRQAEGQLAFVLLLLLSFFLLFFLHLHLFKRPLGAKRSQKLPD